MVGTSRVSGESRHGTDGHRMCGGYGRKPCSTKRDGLWIVRPMVVWIFSDTGGVADWEGEPASHQTTDEGVRSNPLTAPIGRNSMQLETWTRQKPGCWRISSAGGT